MDKNKPLVSIIVPIYNVEKYIGKCLNSIFNQTFRDIEYIFVDDCSTDNSIRILNDYISKQPRLHDSIIVIRHDHNQGLVAARQTGLSNAHGEYILNIDSDDWLDHRMVETLYYKAKDGDLDIVFSNYAEVYPNYTSVIKGHECSDKSHYIDELLNSKLGAFVWNKLVRADIYRKVTFNVGHDMWEDLLTSVQLFFYADKIDYLDSEPLYFYNLNRTGSISRSKTRKKVESMIDNLKFIDRFLSERGITHDTLGRKIYCKLQMINCGWNAKSWRMIFPECNKRICKTKGIGLKYKFMSWIIDHRMDFVYNLYRAIIS